MEDMWAHQLANFELNLLRNGAVIDTDTHMCLPPSNQSLCYILMFLYISTNIRVNKFFLMFTDSYYILLYIKSVQYPVKIKYIQISTNPY